MRFGLVSTGERTCLAAILAATVFGCASPVVAPPESAGAARDERGEDVEAALPGSAGAPVEESSDPPFSFPTPAPEPPLTASASLGRVDARRDASLRLVIAGLEADAVGDAGRALASYQ